MLNQQDVEKITHIVALSLGVDPSAVEYADGAIRFFTDEGEAATKRACAALLEAGLQHTADDGKPEFYVAGAEEADRAEVRWPFDPERPTWK